MRRRNDAFTLVELLLVVALIALLLALLTPSLNRAKELARTANCAANLSQLHKAFLNYAGDERGKLPDTGLLRLDTTSGGYRWHFLWVWNEQTGFHLRDQYLGGDYRAMLCPSSDRQQSESSWDRDSEPGALWTSYISLTSHMIGSHLTDEGPRYYVSSDPGLPINYCDKISTTPADFALMADTLHLMPSGDWGFVNTHPGKGTGFEAARGANVVTMDGAVNWRNIDETRSRLIPVTGFNREYYW